MTIPIQRRRQNGPRLNCLFLCTTNSTNINELVFNGWQVCITMKSRGGLLADDMGLGKTMQVLTYLGSLMRAETICNAIIICPKSVVRSWEREANLNLKNICVPRATVTAVTSDMGKAKRKRVFEDAFCAPSKRPQLVITTYGLVSNHITDLTNISNTYEESRWCYVVLDEGHQIKNSSTKMSRDVRILASRSPHTRRLLMTGTPMQVSTNVF
ncbi:DNA excision repair protein ERCC-6-like protein [Skeletonema marinoi]|uniref:DNA excision repair protein ERCC-6-like protein n=1 Tax=Skeletonema marinoi TaxID=267567 RepID=A0AAD8XY39_9STRA|nr:DNA excision repair protein ERCC-6-like protein [Skeletonema marinoi]